MAIHEWIIAGLALFIIIGALDWCLGSRFGLGEAFQNGVMSMGQIALAMIGIISLAPVVASGLTPVITPIYTAIGADPSSFANTILALDMGGYALAEQMALNDQAGLFSWVFLGTMLGPTIVFTIPIALGMVEANDTDPLAKGMLIGMSTIPLGCFVGGWYAGFEIEMMLRNLLIPVLFSTIVILGLRFKADLSIKMFLVFGRFIQSVGVIGLALAGVEQLTDVTLLPAIAPFEEGLVIVGTIAIVLTGAFPFVAFLTKVGQPLFHAIGKAMRLDGYTITAMITSLAHAIPAFALMKEMPRKGKVVATAFIVSGAFVIGGHLGFVASINQDMVVPMMIGKLTGGFSAAALALMTESGSN